MSCRCHQGRIQDFKLGGVGVGVGGVGVGVGGGGGMGWGGGVVVVVVVVEGSRQYISNTFFYYNVVLCL